MTETKFWNIVKTLGWNRDASYNAVKKQLKEQGRDTCLEFKGLYYKLLDKLNEAARKAGYIFVCDSWDDTLAHTVGLGKVEFDAAMCDPVRLIKRMESGNYKESFSYAVPTESDFPG
jgi:hypothetical protein